MINTRKKAILLAVGILIAAALSVLFFVFAERRVSLFIPNCLLRTATGIKCVFCGGTRCVREILRGNFVKAFYYNPYAIICALLAVIWYIRLVVGIFSKEYKPVRISEGQLWIILISMLVFWAVRNFDFYQNIFY